MPLMVSENGRQQRLVPDRAVAGYLSRGWSRADDTSAEAPSPSDLKADWVAYAEAQGVATDGMTKEDIIAAVAG